MKKYLLSIFLVLLCGCSKLELSQEENMLEYLNNKYENISFEVVEDSICNNSSLGYCEMQFKSNDIEFTVKKKNNVISDNYLFEKYKNEITNHYNSLLSKVINSNFQIEIADNKSDYLWDKTATAKDIIKYENLNLVINIFIANESEDIKSLSERIIELFKKEEIKNIAALYITSYNKNCNLNEKINCNKINTSFIEVKIVEDKPNSE